MHSRIYYNDQLMDAARARLPALSPLSLYGRGIFTTLAIHHGLPFLWDEHYERLTAHAGRSGFRAVIDRETLGGALAKIIAANKVVHGRARVTLWPAESTAGLWRTEGARQGNNRGPAAIEFLIMTGEARPQPAEGLALTVSPYRLNTLSPLVGVKSVNYLEHVLAWEEARARQFDEAVMLNERGEVVSATMANLFWVNDGTLHTPALATGCLAGTTRGCILDLADKLSVPAVESVADLARLGEADELFLTSAGLGVAVVTTFDFHRYSVPVGSVALRLREAFRQLTIKH